MLLAEGSCAGVESCHQFRADPRAHTHCDDGKHRAMGIRGDGS